MSTAPLEFRDRHLRGVWAPLVIPWQGDGSDGRVDAGALRELVARYVASGVHGVYATGTDGEFHVLEVAQFGPVVRAFADAVEAAKIRRAHGWKFNSTAVLRGMRDGNRPGPNLEA